MNKADFIAEKIADNKRSFGCWGSEKRIDSADPVKLLFGGSPTNAEEALQHGNALANTGNYPVGTSECFNVGISGGCGHDCYVYLEGRCTEPQEMVDRLDGSEELERHQSLYGDQGD